MQRVKYFNDKNTYLPFVFKLTEHKLLTIFLFEWTLDSPIKIFL